MSSGTAQALSAYNQLPDRSAQPRGYSVIQQVAVEAVLVDRLQQVVGGDVVRAFELGDGTREAIR